MRKIVNSTLCLFCFFFFQAEDGIRDLTVTGVQTCALPISRAMCLRRFFLTCAQGGSSKGSDGVCTSVIASLREARSARAARSRGSTAADGSEERRVGKECRSRWSPYH